MEASWHGRWNCEKCGAYIDSLTKVHIHSTEFDGMKIHHLLCEKCKKAKP